MGSRIVTCIILDLLTIVIDTTIHFWCRKEWKRQFRFILLQLHSCNNSSNYGILANTIANHCAQTIFHNLMNRAVSHRPEREHFLSDVLSSAVGGLCDPCGSRLIGSWLSWGCALAEVLVDGVIFCFEQVLSIFPKLWKERHIPH